MNCQNQDRMIYPCVTALDVVSSKIYIVQTVILKPERTVLSGQIRQTKKQMHLRFLGSNFTRFHNVFHDFLFFHQEGTNNSETTKQTNTANEMQQSCAQQKQKQHIPLLYTIGTTAATIGTIDSTLAFMYLTHLFRSAGWYANQLGTTITTMLWTATFFHILVYQTTTRSFHTVRQSIEGNEMSTRNKQWIERIEKQMK